MSVKITPEIKTQDGVKITTLKTGDCFLSEGQIWQLFEDDPCAQNLATGGAKDFDETAIVIPVDVQIHWTPKKKEEKKKK